MSTKPFYDKEGGAAVMAVTAALARQDPRRVDIERGNWRRQWQARKSFGAFVPNEFHCFIHSIGTTISLARTMLSRLRAADSMALGSLRNCSISRRNEWLLLRSVSTSVWILAYC